MEKYPGISPYAYCAGNPMNLVDPDGMSMDNYVFDKDGRFIRKELTDDPDKIIYQSEAGDIEIAFADPIHDPARIGLDADENGLTRLSFVSDKDINSLLLESGATAEDNQGLIGKYNYVLHESNYNRNDGEGNLDFAVNPNYGISNMSQYLFVTKGTDGQLVAHDQYNYGNLLWGTAVKALGIPLSVAKLGAHINNFFFDNLSKWQLDSKDDQWSITLGYYWK